ncbi:MAG: hydrogenase maturation protein HypF [Frankiales bacterium]|nr:hydrogenase maturation protein HypF [Frankiales bacterium]
MVVGERREIRTRARVSGLVQGVGFRPFVWREATSLGLSGWVGNDAAGVVLEVEGAAEAVAALLEALHRPPPLSRVDRVEVEPIQPLGDVSFEIRISGTDGPRHALVSPDTGTCADCRRELHDPADRRYRHPFVNCTSCGPRFTIVTSVPYDRARTTMAGFPMCAACRAEYEDPANRRFHAEPVCCPGCGPRLRLASPGRLAGDPLAAAVALLERGEVLAVKGLGGYHLAVDACSEPAVATLRRRKHREDRPFAIMAADVEQARLLCEVSPAEEALMAGQARPIVLLRRRPAAGVAPSVAPGSPTLGVMIPYTPLHTLLLEAFGRPIVLTSGNLSNEPIATADGDAALRLAGIADAFLVHDRPIRTRVDDSVLSVVAGRTLPLRRSRGYVPNPIGLAHEAARPVLAVGSALKNTFCIARGSQAFVSGHIGDLDDHATYVSFLDGIQHLCQLLDVEPSVIAHDLHPDYPSTSYALEREDSGLDLVGVQHHHAHIASCLADNGVTGPVIGVAFDGIGLGTDGTAWGGEFLVADLLTSQRVAHLAQVPMPGGDAAARQPWRMAAAHLDAAYDGAPPTGLAVAARQGARWGQVLSLARAQVNAPLTSSAGRLFDAVSALLGVRDVVTYEGQAAIELEYVADPDETGSYPVTVTDGSPARIEIASLVRDLSTDLLAGVPVPTLAARFHNTLADVVRDVCARLREQHRLETVALSGGVFQNALLVTRCLSRLETAGFEVLTHRQVPPNDGGLSLGQAAVATAWVRQQYAPTFNK